MSAVEIDGVSLERPADIEVLEDFDEANLFELRLGRVGGAAVVFVTPKSAPNDIDEPTVGSVALGIDFLPNVFTALSVENDGIIGE